MRRFCSGLAVSLILAMAAAAQSALPDRHAIHRELQVHLAAIDQELASDNLTAHEQLEIATHYYATAIRATALYVDAQSDTAALIQSTLTERYGDPLAPTSEYPVAALISYEAALRQTEQSQVANQVLNLAFDSLPADPRERMWGLLQIIDAANVSSADSLFRRRTVIEAAELYLDQVDEHRLLRSGSAADLALIVFSLGELELADRMFADSRTGNTPELDLIRDLREWMNREDREFFIPLRAIDELLDHPHHVDGLTSVYYSLTDTEPAAANAVLTLGALASQAAFVADMPSDPRNFEMLRLASILLDRDASLDRLPIREFFQDFDERLVAYTLAGRENWIRSDYEHGEERIFLHWNPDQVPYDLIRVIALSELPSRFDWPRYYQYGLEIPADEGMASDAKHFLQSILDAWPWIGLSPYAQIDPEDERSALLRFVRERYPAETFLPALTAVLHSQASEEPDCYSIPQPQALALWSIAVRNVDRHAAANEALQIALTCARLASDAQNRASGLAAIAAALPE